MTPMPLSVAVARRLKAQTSPKRVMRLERATSEDDRAVIVMGWTCQGSRAQATTGILNTATPVV